ncbi:MAG TPA: MerR family transcriptional regulator [Actinomycetota bacterium]|jgi:DNA-binding transcriptional MerR regulator
MATLTVSMLAKRAGVPAGTVRYYDRAGLLRPAARSPAGYRLYGEDAADRLRFVKGAQRLGLRLREVAELLAVRDRGACPCGHTQALLDRRLGEVDAEVARLVGLRAELARVAAACAPDACPDPAGTWPCEAELIAAGKDVSGHDRAVP